MVAVTQEVLDTITSRLVGALHPQCIYLFGSHAYGSPHPSSDVDVMLVLPRREVRRVELSRQARRAIGSIGCGVDVIVRWVDDFERRASWPSSLEATVRSKGRLLYGRRTSRTDQGMADQG